MLGVASVIGLLLLQTSLGVADPASPPTSKIKIHREGDAVWVEGVRWPAGDRASSVQASQECIMRALGEDVSYDYLVGVSGLAFRMQVSKDGICPTSANPYCGVVCAQRSIQALPWKTKSIEVDGPGAVADAKRQMMESIDRGIPVKHGWEEDGVIVGYRKNGDEWICLRSEPNGKGTYVDPQMPRGINIYVERKTGVTSRRQLVLDSLKQAVSMSETAEANDFWLGLKAWDVYIEKLEALDKAAAKAVADAMPGNAWTYRCLVSYRSNAARYLRMVAPDFDGATADRLRKAAALYDKMATKVLADGMHRPASVAPSPESLKKGELWTSAMRSEQIRRLREALALERSAIALIVEALKTAE